MDNRPTISENDKEYVRRQVEGHNWVGAFDASEVLFKALRLCDYLPNNEETALSHLGRDPFGLAEVVLGSLQCDVVFRLALLTDRSERAVREDIALEMPNIEGKGRFMRAKWLLSEILTGLRMLESVVREREEEEEVS